MTRPTAMLLLFALIGALATATAAQTPSPEGQTFNFPWPPDWVARGKYQKMLLKGITGLTRASGTFTLAARCRTV